MNIERLVARQSRQVFLRRANGAKQATFHPANKPGKSFTFTIAAGDASEAMIVLGNGVGEQSTQPFLASLRELREGIAGCEGVARDPYQGDEVEIPDGARAGVWTVKTCTSDEGDGCTLSLRFERKHQEAAKGVVEGSR